MFCVSSVVYGVSLSPRGFVKVSRSRVVSSYVQTSHSAYRTFGLGGLFGRPLYFQGFLSISRGTSRGLFYLRTVTSRYVPSRAFSDLLIVQFSLIFARVLWGGLRCFSILVCTGDTVYIYGGVVYSSNVRPHSQVTFFIYSG